MRNLFIIFILFSFSLSAQKADKKDEKTKSYNSIINNEVITDQGLFKVPKKDDEYYYEIHSSQLNQEMLMVNRIAKTINGIGYGGQKINSQVLRWQKKNNQILLRIVRKIFDLDRKIKNKIKRTRDDATSNHLKYISMQLSEFIDD